MDYTELSREELEARLLKLETAANKQKQQAIKYIQDNQNIRLFNSCKSNAKRKGLEFDLEIEDVVIPTHCIYLGWELTNTSNQGRVDTNASIDRIDSSKGYTKDNIIIISDLANKMKNSSTMEQLLTFARNVIKLHDKPNNN